MNVMHSCRNDDWLTPVYLLDMAKEVLGEIDLDPASSEMGNARVRAKQYRTVATDGLQGAWGSPQFPRTIFLNPPGGKVKNLSKTALFWKKLMHERDLWNVRHAIFLAFSAEALQNTQGKDCDPIMSFPFCVPAKRIRFDFPGPALKSAPSHSNVVVYVPGRVDETRRFRDVFGRIGAVR